MYQFTAEELWKEWTWKERFPSWQELRQYFAFVDKKWDLSRDIQFNTTVLGGTFDESTEQWTLTTDDGTKAATVKARFFVPCMGFASRPHMPDFKGLENFKGICHHTSMWPQDGLELTGKRVAIIGTGASGVQTIQEIGPLVKHLTVYQRTPNLALPMMQKKLDAASQEKEKPGYAEFYKSLRKNFTGFDYDFMPKMTLEETPEDRIAYYESLYAEGGFRFWLSNYQDLLLTPEANDEAYAFWCQKTQARVRDPVTAEKLAPLKAPHPFGTKRPCLEQAYYEVYNQPNVDLVDLRSTPLDEITARGVRTADGTETEVDVLILATGFDQTGPLTQLDIKSVTGQTLREKWEPGVVSYLGMTTAGFPNLFFSYGPHGPTAFCNGPTCIEIQGEWIVRCIKHMVDNGFTRIDVLPEKEIQWRDDIQNQTNMSLLTRAKSWYMGANIPGRTPEGLNYFGGVPLYYETCTEVANNGYKGFTLSSQKKEISSKI